MFEDFMMLCWVMRSFLCPSPAPAPPVLRLQEVSWHLNAGVSKFANERRDVSRASNSELWISARTINKAMMIASGSKQVSNLHCNSLILNLNSWILVKLMTKSTWDIHAWPDSPISPSTLCFCTQALLRPPNEAESVAWEKPGSLL